tara:strand:+ start:297 stop:539 length:243 start_codon:yes stop_codon:yes gene_type:complete
MFSTEMIKKLLKNIPAIATNSHQNTDYSGFVQILFPRRLTVNFFINPWKRVVSERDIKKAQVYPHLIHMCFWQKRELSGP